MKNKPVNTNFKLRRQWTICLTAASMAFVCVVAVFALVQTKTRASGIEKYALSQTDGGQIANGQDQKDLIKQIQASQNVTYRVVGNEDSPLKITEATGKEISNEQYAKLTGETTVTIDAGGKTIFPNVYSAPEVKMLNSSGKTISGYILTIRHTELRKTRLELTRRLSITAGQNYVTNLATAGINRPMSSPKYWLEFPDREKLYIKIAKISFADGTTWTAKETE